MRLDNILNWALGLIIFAVVIVALVGCGETASTWDSQQGRFRSTEEMKEERRQEIRDLECRLAKIEGKKCIPE